VRTDSSVSRRSFRYSDGWRRDAFSNARVPEIDRRLKGGEVIDGRQVIHSLSGHERNHLFLNGQGKDFTDISLISGLDNPADSRGFVLLDYDRDGRQDIAMVNANNPLFNLYRNNIVASDTNGQSTRPGFIAVQFEGGNHTAEPAKTSCRDGFGAMVTLELGDKTIKREHRCGEGYGTQNSSTLMIGMGASEKAESLTVRWPAGSEFALQEVDSGLLVTAYEDPQAAPNKQPFVVEPYAGESAADSNKEDRGASFATSGDSRTIQIAFDTAPSLPSKPDAQPQLRLYMTMATWCMACKEQTPHLELLADTFTPEELEIVGLPVDEKEDAALLREYFEVTKPPYRLVLALDEEQRRSVRKSLSSIIPPDAIPASIVTAADGRVLFSSAGVPTVSELRRISANAAP
jgi:thiol-disulfide isomerase/thioredoxin